LLGEGQVKLPWFWCIEPSHNEQDAENVLAGKTGVASEYEQSKCTMATGSSCSTPLPGVCMSSGSNHTKDTNDGKRKFFGFNEKQLHSYLPSTQDHYSGSPKSMKIPVWIGKLTVDTNKEFGLTCSNMHSRPVLLF
jgi:hypothetical protein